MATKPNFKNQLEKLEEIVAWFEKEDVDLDVALAKFEEGIKLAGDLKSYLETAQNKVETIKKKFDQPSKSDPKLDL